MQARDLGSTRQALKKRLHGTGRKGTVPITEKQRLVRLRFRTQLQICTQSPLGRGVERGPRVPCCLFPLSRAPSRNDPGSAHQRFSS